MDASLLAGCYFTPIGDGQVTMSWYEHSPVYWGQQRPLAMWTSRIPSGSILGPIYEVVGYKDHAAVRAPLPADFMAVMGKPHLHALPLIGWVILHGTPETSVARTEDGEPVRIYMGADVRSWINNGWRTHFMFKTEWMGATHPGHKIMAASRDFARYIHRGTCIAGSQMLHAIVNLQGGRFFQNAIDDACATATTCPDCRHRYPWKEWLRNHRRPATLFTCIDCQAQFIIPNTCLYDVTQIKPVKGGLSSCYPGALLQMLTDGILAAEHTLCTRRLSRHACLCELCLTWRHSLAAWGRRCWLEHTADANTVLSMHERILALYLLDKCIPNNKPTLFGRILFAAAQQSRSEMRYSFSGRLRVYLDRRHSTPLTCRICRGVCSNAFLTGFNILGFCRPCWIGAAVHGQGAGTAFVLDLINKTRGSAGLLGVHGSFAEKCPLCGRNAVTFQPIETCNLPIGLCPACPCCYMHFDFQKYAADDLPKAMFNIVLTLEHEGWVVTDTYHALSDFF